ncbi:MAG TPA: S-methyl-5'-thioadenosine phosphorylase [Candidatus Dormibacteraeota bacterium]|jgi:5'-methylthioadenosine phosphorylase|nr:S-methyl-5'-thioadenosine phosphorylase [Candidatus Dormibacteraeota bacterium]
MTVKAEVGVFGGSGFYRFLDEVEFVAVDTPYGPPSDRVALGELGGVRVAFLPRHGARHQLPPGAINYRANLWALKELGVSRVLAPAAAGSLQPQVKPGDFVICDQFVDRTRGRADSFFSEGPRVAHVSAADPYCPVLRGLAIATARELGITVHERGTVVVIQGPRFSTRAESRWFSTMGWEVVNMTQYPEVVLARELELCYVNISLITDYDVGLEDHPEVQPVSVAEVEKVLADNNQRVQRLIRALVPRLPAERTCPCATAMQGAFIGG